MWKIFLKTSKNSVRFDELVQCLESVGTWIQCHESKNSIQVRRTVTNMFEKYNKNPETDALSEDEFINR